ncbi:MAG: ATP-dependent sacrificial sulfur transferase LarE [bacterium]
MQLSDKRLLLKEVLIRLKRVLVAFSGGVDSTFLLKSAVETLGRENVTALIADSLTYPVKEREEAINFCINENIEFILIKSDEMDDERFTNNDANRCYYCKKHLYEMAKEIAKKRNIPYIVEGSNYDDLNDYRPGRRALEEIGILSPLLEAKFTKQEIRTVSKELGLPTHSKPSKACLASRVPYGTRITSEVLKKIELAENLIEGYGISQVRVRAHDKIARIEVVPEEFGKILVKRKEIVSEIKNIGFNYVTLDLVGYRTGSMNEVL